MDNIFVERLWRSLKYEEVYLSAEMPSGGRQGDGTIVVAADWWSTRRNDLNRCRVAFDQGSTVIAVVEMSQSSRRVGVCLSRPAKHTLW
jgi:hypothetical protein